MKTLTQYLNENISYETPVNESNWGATEYKEVAKRMEEHIGDLENRISKILGVKPKLNVSATPHSIEIESDNLLPQLKDKMWDCLYKEIIFGTWGGTHNERDNAIWFDPKLFWTHTDSGSNGHRIGGISEILFKLDTNKWEIK